MSVKQKFDLRIERLNDVGNRQRSPNEAANRVARELTDSGYRYSSIVHEGDKLTARDLIDVGTLRRPLAGAAATVREMLGHGGYTMANARIVGRDADEDAPMSEERRRQLLNQSAMGRAVLAGGQAK